MLWIDLSAHGMKLLDVEIPPQNGAPATRILLMQGGDRNPEALAALGFFKHGSGAWVFSKAARPGLADFERAFPQARRLPDADPKEFVTRLPTQGTAPAARPAAPVEAPRGPIVAAGPPGAGPARQPRPERPAEAGPLAPEPQRPVPETTEQILAHARFLGLNRRGQKVHEHPRGRFYLDQYGRPTFEADVQGQGIQNALFLRAADEASLAGSAEGFVEEMTDGSVLRLADLKRFASAVFGEEIGDADPRLVRAHTAVEGALARWLARKGGASMRDVFNGAVRLHEAHPYVGDLGRRQPEGFAPLPQPVAVVVQRILGTEADLQGKKVVIAGAGAGSLFAHLPRASDVRIYESDAAVAVHARATLSSAGRAPDCLFVTEPDFSGADMVAACLPRALLDRPRTYEGGLTVGRADLAQVIDSLEVRAPLGRSVFVLRCGEAPEEIEEMERVREWIASRYAIDGTADLEGALHSGRAEDAPMRILAIGRRRPAPLAVAFDEAMERTEITDFSRDLYSWTQRVVANRALVADYYAKQEAKEAEGAEAADPTLSQNYFQAPYVAASGVGQASTMVPRNLEGATREALGRVARKHPDFDQWIANELGMTVEQLGERFSPEQVDGVGLYIDAEERGRAFLNADQTGIGKGRFIAAVMRRAAMQGKKVLFLTESEINLSDIVRDIRHTQSEAEFSTLILNNGAKIIDEATGEVVMRSPKADEVDAIMRTRAWPAEHNLVLATYSQFSKPGVAPEKRVRRGRAAAAAAAAVVPQPEAEAAAEGDAAEVQDDGVNAKSAWIRAAIDENTIVILDEAHNVSNAASNRAANIQAAIERAGGVVFSSATFAKAAKNMGIYAPLFPPGFDSANVTEIVRRGGETMQETLSAMLVKDGVMLTRQHDLSKCKFTVEMDEGGAERNRDYMDRLAPVLAEMAYLSGDLDKRVNAMNDMMERELLRRMRGNENAVRRRMKSMQVNRMGFGSPLYNLSRLFVCSLLIDKVAKGAIDDLRNGKKPVIMVENTIQSVLEDLAAGQDAVDGAVVPDFRDLMRRALGQLTKIKRATKDGQEAVDLAKPEPELEAAEAIAEIVSRDAPESVARADQEGIDPDPDHKATLNRAVDAAAERLLADGHPVTQEPEAFARAIERVRALVANMPDDAKQAAAVVRRLPALMPDTPARAVRRINALIDQLPPLPASAIDEVRDRIEAEGERLFQAGEIERPWKVGEITGRSWECRNGRIGRRPATSKTEEKNRFNSGEIDGMVINVAGATGIDLHAGRRFADQRPRVMRMLQAPADIAKEVQGVGRVNRFDQVVGPEIVTPMAGLPIELRLVAMRNAKLRRLSANVTSNRENAALVGDIPDLMNAVGDIVCARYGEARPELMRRLGFEVARNADVAARNVEAAAAGGGEDQKDNERSANVFLARLAMLPTAMQEETIADLDAEFRATVEELDAKGENPLKSEIMDGIVHQRERTVFDGADVENPTSEFHRPVFAQRIIIEKTVEPMRGEQVAIEAERGAVALGADGPDAFADRISRRRNGFLQIFLTADDVSVEDALAQERPVITAMNRKLDALIDVLGRIRPGVSISLTMDGVAERGVVTRMHMPNPHWDGRRRGNEFIPAAYEAEYFLPGDHKPRYASLESLMKDTEFKIEEGLHGPDYEKVMADFDRALEGSKLEPRTILVGNDWQAMNLSLQHKLGKMVSWEDDKGVRHRGVLVSKKHLNLDFLPIYMRSPKMAAEAAASAGADIHSSSKLNGAGVAIRKLKDGRFVVRLPSERSREFGGIYEHPPIQALVQRLNQAEDNDTPKLVVNKEALEPIIGHLVDAGARFYISSRFRDWSNGWMAENFAQGAAPAVNDGEAEKADGRQPAAA